MTFERAVEAHRVERDKRAAILHLSWQYWEKSGKQVGKVMRVFCPTSYKVRERLEEMSELVSENVRGAQKCQKLWYDQNAKELETEEEV